MPGQLEQPKVTYYNKTDLNVTWSPLKHHRGGYNDLYLVKVHILNSNRDLIRESIREIKAYSGGKQNPAIIGYFLFLFIVIYFF